MTVWIVTILRRIFTVNRGSLCDPPLLRALEMMFLCLKILKIKVDRCIDALRCLDARLRNVVRPVRLFFPVGELEGSGLPSTLDDSLDGTVSDTGEAPAPAPAQPVDG